MYGYIISLVKVIHYYCSHKSTDYLYGRE